MRYDPHFTLTADNRADAIAYLVSRGHPEPSLVLASNVLLANLYHMTGETPSATDTGRMVAQAVISTLAHMPAAPPIDIEALRAVIREEIESLAPRRIEISGPRGVVTLDGAQHYCTLPVLRMLGRGDAVMMVGPAGCGKTTIGEKAAIALGLDCYITSVVNDTHELLGYTDGYGKYHPTPFRAAFTQGGVWIADEIDAWDAAALLAANAALANGFANFPDTQAPVRRHENFRMVATANTFGTGADRIYVGRNELDAASLDRFSVIEVGYDLDLERMFANGADKWLEYVWSVRQIVQEKRIRHVVSSRAIIRGAIALADGEKWDDVCEWYLFKGMSGKDRSKVDD
jgi:hypothetical protein